MMKYSDQQEDEQTDEIWRRCSNYGTHPDVKSSIATNEQMEFGFWAVGSMLNFQMSLWT